MPRGIMLFGPLLIPFVAGRGLAVPPDVGPPAWVPLVAEAVRMRGEPEFHFGLTQGTPPPNADPGNFIELTTEAMCLWNRSIFPPDWGVTGPADPTFNEHVTAANALLANRARELQKFHEKDADYQARPGELGWSAALEEKLTADLRRALGERGFYVYLWESFKRDRASDDSCVNRAVPRVLAAIEQKQGKHLLPESEQWKALVTICNGSPESVRDHISLRVGDPSVSAVRSAAFSRLLSNDWLVPCLVRAIENEPPLAKAVRQYNDTQSYEAAAKVRERAQLKWTELGLPAAIDEVMSGGPGPSFSKLEKACNGAGSGQPGSER